MAEAKKILDGIEASLIRSDYSLRREDWDQDQQVTRLSDIMPSILMYSLRCQTASFGSVSSRFTMSFYNRYRSRKELFLILWSKMRLAGNQHHRIFSKVIMMA